MSSSMVSTVLRRLATRKAIVPQAGNRTFHSSGMKQAGHGSSGGELYSNDYLHAPHMYDITNMKQRSLKMGLLVFGSLALGTAVPIVACQYQIQKSSTA